MGNKSKAAVAALLAMSLAGCTNVLPSIDARLKPIAAPLLADQAGDASNFLSTPQPEPYASIIRKNFNEVQFRFDDNIRTLENGRLRARQSRLPQVIPSASLGTSGLAGVDLGFRQALTNGDLSKALFHDADIQAVSRQITLLEALNNDVLDDIDTYLEYHENIEREALLSELAGRLDDLLSVAETRLQGGIGTADEVALFSLELTEVQTEALIAKSNASVELSSLDKINASIPPRTFVRQKTHLPIEVLAAVAERDEAQSNLAVVTETAEPRLVLEATGRFGVTTVSPVSNAGIRVETDPIQFGGNADILEAEQNAFLAERELEQTIFEVERDTLRLLQQIAALKIQEEQTVLLVNQTQSRLEGFRARFQAGNVGFSEAAGLVDTLRRSLEQRVEVKYRILGLQSELAASLGHFWTF